MKLVSKRKVAALASATLLSMAGLAMSAVPAQASGGCPVPSFYGVTDAGAVRIPFAGIPTFKNGPGGTISVTKDYSASASYQVTAGASAEVNGVFAKASVTLSASITKTNSSSVTNNYSHAITNGKYGHAQYVAWGRKVNWKKQIFNGSCVIVTLSSGTINFPTNEEGWYYWETSS